MNHNPRQFPLSRTHQVYDTQQRPQGDFMVFKAKVDRKCVICDEMILAGSQTTPLSSDQAYVEKLKRVKIEW
jgi:hypothetical protein